MMWLKCVFLTLLTASSALMQEDDLAKQSSNETVGSDNTTTNPVDETATDRKKKIQDDLYTPTSQLQSESHIYCTLNELFCVPFNYSRYVPPIISENGATVKPLDVSIGFDNFEILKIDDRDFTVEINAYLIVKWRDSRIVIDFEQIYKDDETARQRSLSPEEISVTKGPPRKGNSSFPPEWIPVELELITKLWKPDSEILRLKGFHSLSVLDRLQGLWMSVNHEILFVVATRIKFMCPMNYGKFPMDMQTCKFQIGSFNYDNTKMRYHTYYLPKLPNATESVLDFDVRIVSLLPNEKYYLPQETGNYSVAGFTMIMNRKVSHYVITYYLPSGLFVVVSWASFLIPADDIQGRMALLVTLFLVLVNIFNAITTNSPKADGLNALQAWIITCIFFIFGALFEYSVILLRLKLWSLQRSASEAVVNMSNNLSAINVSNGLSMSVHHASFMRKNQNVTRFDLVCLVLFPILFVLFMFVYFLTVVFI